MIILIAGDTHTGKTILAQKLLEKYKYSYLSIDHLKMGLIRSGQCKLSADSNDMELTNYLWPIVREMINRLQTPLQQGHPAVFRQQVGQRHGLAHRVQDPSVLNQ